MKCFLDSDWISPNNGKCDLTFIVKERIISLTNLRSLTAPHIFSASLSFLHAVVHQSILLSNTVNEQRLCTLCQLMALTNHVYLYTGLYRSHSSVFIQKSQMDEKNPPLCHVCSLNNSCSCWRSVRTLCFILITSCFFLLLFPFLSLFFLFMFSWAWKSLSGMFPFQGCMFVHVLCFHP